MYQITITYKDPKKMMEQMYFSSLKLLVQEMSFWKGPEHDDIDFNKELLKISGKTSTLEDIRKSPVIQSLLKRRFHNADKVELELPF